MLISGYSSVSRCYRVDDDVRNNAIAKALPRNTFDKWLKFLHLANNDTLQQGDRYAKVSPLIDMLNARYVSMFPVKREISVDETMVKFFGRHLLDNVSETNLPDWPSKFLCE